MDEVDTIIVDSIRNHRFTGAFIACFYTGRNFPDHCEPMFRDPAPEVGRPFGTDFPAQLRTALKLNAAVHDGAVMIGRNIAGEPYRVVGWSFRLFPPRSRVQAPPNRGSAFNSCLAMSEVPGIDCLYCGSDMEAWRFAAGDNMQLNLQSVGIRWNRACRADD